MVRKRIPQVFSETTSQEFFRIMIRKCFNVGQKSPWSKINIFRAILRYLHCVLQKDTKMLLCCVQGFVGHHLCHRTKGKRNRNRIYKAVINACNAEILFFFFLQRQCSVLIDDTVNNKLIHSLAELLKKKKKIEWPVSLAIRFITTVLLITPWTNYQHILILELFRQQQCYLR